MVKFTGHPITDDSALGGSVIERSLRYGRVSNTYLARTNGSAGNQKTWTYSFWMKRTRTGNINLLNEGNTNALPWTFLYIENHKFHFWNITSGGVGGVNYWYDLIRDLNAWYHIVLRVDTTQSTAANRVRLYINGTEATIQQDNRSSISQNVDTQINGTDEVRIGNNVPTNQSLQGYLADVYIIDGQSLDPSYFGYTDFQTGLWRPKRYTGTYGTNGFHLEFNDNSGTTATTLGKDTSGNGNNWTPNNFSVSAGAENDSLEDTPTNNFPTFNHLNSIVRDNNYNAEIRAGGLLMVGADVHASTSLNLPKSGKWYVEFSKYGNGAPQAISVTRANKLMTSYDGALGLADHVQYVSNGEIGNRTRGSTSDAPTWQDDANIVVAAAVDMDNGAVYFARANTWINSGDPTSGSAKTGAIATDLLTDNNGEHYIGAQGYNGSNSYGMYINFGQRPFTYTPPSGYKTLNSKNLPPNVPSIIRPQKHFDCILYTGQNTSSLYNVTGLEFAPDFVWAKSRNDTIGHIIIDTVRGDDKQLEANTTGVEVVRGTPSYRFLKDGFAVSTGGNMNNPVNYAAWCWKAGGAAVTNTDGTITSQVSANTEAGFSIMTWQGTGYVSGKTIGHGLGKAPKMIWAKRRNISTDNWAIYFNDGTTKVSWFFNTSAAINPAQASYWPANDPTSSVFYIGTDSAVNGSASMEYVGYAWAEIPGYSKIGTYEGNGNSNGTYVHLGFRPAWVLLRRVDSTGNWIIFDNKRNTYNSLDRYLVAEATTVEQSGTAVIDFLSNGFKIYNTWSSANGGTMTYMAFAEQPGTTPFDTFTNAR